MNSPPVLLPALGPGHPRPPRGDLPDGLGHKVRGPQVTAAPPGPAAQRKRRLVKTMVKTVHRELGPQAGDLHATLGRVTEGAVVLSTLLEDADKFSLAASGRLDTEGLRNAGSVLAEVSRKTE